jgi:alpha-L-fucosidase
MDAESYSAEDTGHATRSATPEGLQSFVDAAYGLSVHWGLYAINGRGEWVMHQERIPFDVYRERLGRFNPTRFNAEEWADLMVEAGQKYLLITTKHHDGFCMWDTALTEWKITNTPFQRDVLAELAPALRDRGLKLYYYYSLLDWTHPAYRTDWPAYVAYYQGHLRELLTRYGEVGAVIFDGYWPRAAFGPAEAHFAPGGAWDLAGTYDLIHELQPGAVVINNTHILPLKGEDAQVFELDFPGENSAGFNTTEVSAQPTLVWWNLNTGWAYAPRTHLVKSPDTILASLDKAQATHSVFALNVGPRAFGDIHPEEAQVLRTIGQRLRAR